MGQVIKATPRRHKHREVVEVAVRYLDVDRAAVHGVVERATEAHTLTERRDVDGGYVATWRYEARGANRSDITKVLTAADFNVVRQLTQLTPHSIFVAQRGRPRQRLCACTNRVTDPCLEVADEA